MNNNKVFILLPDGIGLRNFAYTKFYKYGQDNGLDFTFWNSTPFPLSEFGFKEIPLPQSQLNLFTEVYKNARKHIELNQFKKQYNDPVFDTYKFPFKYNSLKRSIKNLLTKFVISSNDNPNGLVKVRKKIFDLERQADYYKACHKVLEKEKPAILFSTNQRPVIAIAPILAAQDLGIPTATFIFSWDNLPKATMVIETDYYFVWSEYMKNELLSYYSFIKESQIIITGTPQFENHLNEIEISKVEFFNKYGLDKSKQYITYSGDDVVTSPDDASYLEDVAKAIRKLNLKGHNLGLVFRRCPVDFSNRYDEVLNTYNDIIVPIEPKWDKLQDNWNTIYPTKEDLHLLQQTASYTDLVINLGSTMVFDFVAQNKPCAFINYDAKDKAVKSWSVKKIYNYMHFRSMPSKDVVIWLDNPITIEDKIEEALNGNNMSTVKAAQEWFKVVNLFPLENASVNIVKSIKGIITK